MRYLHYNPFFRHSQERFCNCNRIARHDWIFCENEQRESAGSESCDNLAKYQKNSRKAYLSNLPTHDVHKL